MDEEIKTEGAPPGPAPVKRSNLLTILCILTIVNGGLTLISSIFVAAFYDQFVVIATELAEKLKMPGLEMITEGKPPFFFMNAILYGVSIAGALMMWRMIRNGFHVYTIAQIVLILSPMYFFKLSGPSIFDILLSGTFVMLYATQLKTMK